MNFFKAVKAFWQTLLAKELVEKTQKTQETQERQEDIDEFTAGAIYAVNLLQREGRLVDFLMEDLELYNDAQVGMAARQIHRQSSEALKKYFNPVAVVVGTEGKEIVLSKVDLTSIKVSGGSAISGECRGVLRHKGWRAEANLPKLVGKNDSTIIFQAEISS